LPYPARPLTSAERELARGLAATHGQESLEEAAPIQMVGSGTNLNEAADKGIARLAALVKEQYRL
jgi:formamidase